MNNFLKKKNHNHQNNLINKQQHKALKMTQFGFKLQSKVRPELLVGSGLCSKQLEKKELTSTHKIKKIKLN